MILINLIKHIFSIFLNTTIILSIALGTIVIIQEFNIDFYLHYYKNKLHDAITNMDAIVWPSIFDDIGDSIYMISDEENEDASPSVKQKKYEDKYLDVVREMANNIVFTDIELEMLNIHKREFYRAITDNYINNINDLNSKIEDLKLEISVLKEYDVTEENKHISNIDTSVSSSNIKKIEKDIQCYTNDIQELEKKMNDKNQIEYDALEEAKKIIINERYDKLTNCFVIEKTPLGNVLMFYNNKRGSFEYYSDNTVPYRYLEVVGRKYVKMFHCRGLYFDMEEELHKYEENMQRMQRLEEEKQKNKSDTTQNNSNNNLMNKDKKNVFAKFKSYNKEAGTGHVITGAPAKNNIVNTQVNNANADKLILKENANRYTYEGKLCNFSFVKKIPRKAVDKKYALTFADFKKMQSAQK
jgi:hypothetical protein